MGLLSRFKKRKENLKDEYTAVGYKGRVKEIKKKERKQKIKAVGIKAGHVTKKTGGAVVKHAGKSLKEHRRKGRPRKVKKVGKRPKAPRRERGPPGIMRF